MLAKVRPLACQLLIHIYQAQMEGFQQGQLSTEVLACQDRTLMRMMKDALGCCVPERHGAIIALYKSCFHACTRHAGAAAPALHVCDLSQRGCPCVQPMIRTRPATAAWE